MRKINNSIEKTESPKDSHVYSHSQDKKASRTDAIPEASKNPLLLALGSVVILFKRELRALSNKAKGGPRPSSKSQILENLVSFRKLLDRIAKTDQSYNPEFIRKMSKLWHSITQDYYYQQSLGKKNFLNSDKMGRLIEKMNSYPKKEEFSFGYYLTEYVGEKWIPFPFIDCLLSLYEEHQKNPSRSYLQSFIDLLNDIIANFEAK